MTALDTTVEAEAIQLSIHRRLGPEARFRVAVEMSDAVVMLAETGIRYRHSEYSDKEVKAALIKQLHGVEGQQP